jgi:hypothetical protein
LISGGVPAEMASEREFDTGKEKIDFEMEFSEEDDEVYNGIIKILRIFYNTIEGDNLDDYLDEFDEEDEVDDDFDEDAMSYDDDELVEEHPFEVDPAPQAVLFERFLSTDFL